MKHTKTITLLLTIAIILTGCSKTPPGQKKTETAKNFGQDLSILKEHTDIIVLSDETGGTTSSNPAKFRSTSTHTAAKTGSGSDRKAANTRSSLPRTYRSTWNIGSHRRLSIPKHSISFQVRRRRQFFKRKLN